VPHVRCVDPVDAVTKGPRNSGRIITVESNFMTGVFQVTSFKTDIPQSHFKTTDLNKHSKSRY